MSFTRVHFRPLILIKDLIRIFHLFKLFHLSNINTFFALASENTEAIKEIKQLYVVFENTNLFRKETESIILVSDCSQYKRYLLYEFMVTSLKHSNWIKFGRNTLHSWNPFWQKVDGRQTTCILPRGLQIKFLGREDQGSFFQELVFLDA